ncbi:cytochrome b5 domain-containing protein [Streptomyces sp. NPDC006367]|uniref:cytochrome b5 domain-containing protein n=1 Tax=unclassified Streptomyces TaxID=2593676 RepID=UPI0033B7AA13
MDPHPGGATPLANYLGTDVTEIFEYIGHDRDGGVTAFLCRMWNGVAGRPHPSSRTRPVPLPWPPRTKPGSAGPRN